MCFICQNADERRKPNMTPTWRPHNCHRDALIPRLFMLRDWRLASLCGPQRLLVFARSLSVISIETNHPETIPFAKPVRTAGFTDAQIVEIVGLVVENV